MPVLLSPIVTIASVLGSIYPPLVVDTKVQDRMFPLSEVYSNLMEETGYMHLQSTKPDTIGKHLGLVDLFP